MALPSYAVEGGSKVSGHPVHPILMSVLTTCKQDFHLVCNDGLDNCGPEYPEGADCCTTGKYTVILPSYHAYPIMFHHCVSFIK